MAETYFITGAQGCIGSWIVKALAGRGDTAIVFDRSEDTRRLNAIMEPRDLERVRVIAGDITDVSGVRAALEASGARRIIHLAGLQVPTTPMKAAVLVVPFHIRFSGAIDFQYVADTAAAFIACADRAPEGAHVFNLHGETVEVARIAQLINQNSMTANRQLVTYGGPPIPIAPAINDAAIKRALGDLPSKPLAAGIRETMQRFAELRDAGRLDTSDIESELYTSL